MKVSIEPHHKELVKVILKPHPWLKHDRLVAYMKRGDVSSLGWTRFCELTESQKRIVKQQIMRVTNGASAHD